MSKKRKRWPKENVDCIDIPLYGGEIYLVKNKEDYNQCLDWLGVEDDCGIVRGRTYMMEREGLVIYLVLIIDEDIEALVHELAHVCFFVLNRAGVDVQEGNNEAFCYLLHNLFSECVLSFK